MSYNSIECWPDTDYLTGQLILKEVLVKEDYALDVLSIVLYPSCLVIAAFAQLYFGIDYAIHKYKNLRLNRKITQITDMTDDQVLQAKDRRIIKLEARKTYHRKLYHNPLGEAQIPELPPARQEDEKTTFQRVKDAYLAAKASYEGNPTKTEQDTFVNYAVNVRRIRAYERVSDEVDSYAGKTAAEIRADFIARYQFKKLRHEMHQHVDKHYLKNCLRIQIPVIGMIWHLHSRNTTKTSLENTDLVTRYNASIAGCAWLKPYN